jgi:hypothetical protein
MQKAGEIQEEIMSKSGSLDARRWRKVKKR